MDGYVSKPVQADYLLETITQFTSSAVTPLDAAQHGIRISRRGTESQR